MTQVLNAIVNNPYRILGVLSNSPLKERIGNQNRIAAFAKVGKEMTFPNDFAGIIPAKPLRTADSVTTAVTSLNLAKDQLTNALFWFISASPIDQVALGHLQTGNSEKAKELFEKKETFSTLLNLGVIHMIYENYAAGFSNISKVIHTDSYRREWLCAIGLDKLTISEDETAGLFIARMLQEVSPCILLNATTNSADRALITRMALEEPLSKINSAIAVAKHADTDDAQGSLSAGTKLMNSTKEALSQVKEIAGAGSPQYQMAADNLAKQILQCGINYYNNAPEDDVEAPRKAMVLQKYALDIAVGKLTKDRCQENHDILKKAVDNIPPAEVAIEVGRVKEELRRFCSQPDKISYSIILLNNTKPLLQTIKSKLGASHAFYLSLSTQVVGNALHNLIEEVNEVQNRLEAVIAVAKKVGVNPSVLNSLDIENTPANIIQNRLKPVLRDAWRATTIMDGFDMEADFRNNRYLQNRNLLKGMCDNLKIPTHVSTPRTTSTTTSSPSRLTNSSRSSSGSSNTKRVDPGVAKIICGLAGAAIGMFMSGTFGGFVLGLALGILVLGNTVAAIINNRNR